MIEYVPGKQAWYEENQPREGKAVDEIWVGDLAGSDVPTCGLSETIGEVRRRTAGWDTCVVVDSERVVLGLLRKKELDVTLRNCSSRCVTTKSRPTAW